MNATRLWLTLATALLIPALGHSRSAQESEQTSSMQRQHGMMGRSMSEECRTVMTEREQMMSQMKQSREEMSALVNEMHEAKGDAKVQAIEDVVSALVEQRGQMMQHMAEMQPAMMAHMMRHMHMNMQQGGEDPAAGCPMMKEMMSMSKGDSESAR